MEEEQKRKSKALPVAMAGLMIVILLGLGLFSMQRLGVFHNMMTEINVRYTPELRQLNDIASNSERVRNLQSLTLVTKDTAQKESVSKRMHYAQERRKEAWTAHVKSLPEDQKNMIQPATKAWENYLALSEAGLTLAHKGNEAAAVSLFNVEAQQAMDQYRGAFNAYLDYVTGNIHKMAEQGDVLYNESCAAIVLVFLFAVPMALLAGFAVSTLWV